MTKPTATYFFFLKKKKTFRVFVDVNRGFYLRFSLASSAA